MKMQENQKVCRQEGKGGIQGIQDQERNGVSSTFPWKLYMSAKKKTWIMSYILSILDTKVWFKEKKFLSYLAN